MEKNRKLGKSCIEQRKRLVYVRTASCVLNLDADLLQLMHINVVTSGIRNCRLFLQFLALL